MNTNPLPRGVLALSLVLALAGPGFVPVTPAAVEKPANPATVKKVPVGKNVTLEIAGDKRRVLVNAYVCLRQGQLEQLMTRKRTKEHEAILAADVDARHIHQALLVAGAKEGRTVHYKKVGDKVLLIPPSGTPIKVTLQYKDKNKLVTVPAKEWVRVAGTKKSLAHDWVFAGSHFYPDPLDPKKPKMYGANDGDVICVSNFETAMLDLPINSSKDNAELAFEAYTDRIPPVGTEVTIILEPVLKAKKK